MSIRYPVPDTFLFKKYSIQESEAYAEGVTHDQASMYVQEDVKVDGGPSDQVPTCVSEADADGVTRGRASVCVHEEVQDDQLFYARVVFINLDLILL